MFTKTNPDGIPKLDSAAVTPAGSTQATATPITKALNIVTGADGTKGVVLPSGTVLRDNGLRIVIVNVTAAILKIYPAGAAGTIDGGSAAAALSLAASKRVELYMVGANTWYSLIGA